jgi:hypothetical protein
MVQEIEQVFKYLMGSEEGDAIAPGWKLIQKLVEQSYTPQS